VAIFNRNAAHGQAMLRIEKTEALTKTTLQPVRKIDGASKRVYVVTANIFAGCGDEG